MKEKSAAMLTIHNAARLTKRGKRNIIKWLDDQISFLEFNSDDMSSRFTARYLYTPRLLKGGGRMKPKKKGGKKGC